MTISLNAGIKKLKEIKKERPLELFKDSFVEATGMLIPTTPFFAAFETLIPKYLGYAEPMISKYIAFPEYTPSDSVDARIKTIAAMYIGFGFLFSKGRDISRESFNIDKESRGIFKKIHDGIYAATIGLPAAAYLYYTNDDLSNLQIIQGVVASTVASSVLGMVTGLGIDYARDLMQNKKSVRVPDYISNLPRNAKYAIVGVSALASIAATEGVYRIKDSIYKNRVENKKEIKINNLESKILDSKTYDTTEDFYNLVKYNKK